MICIKLHLLALLISTSVCTQFDGNINFGTAVDRHANNEGAIIKQNTFNNGNTQAVLGEAVGKDVGVNAQIDTPFGPNIQVNNNAKFKLERLQIFDDNLGSFVFTNQIRLYFDINGVKDSITVDAGIPFLNVLAPL